MRWPAQDPFLIERRHYKPKTAFPCKLRAQQCRYFVSDETEAIFCGAPTDDGSSWCPWHRQVVYTKPTSGGARTGRGFALPGPR
ncbi:GcrA family cell cycle regulator [Microvirga terrae]|uniref:GcrA family cell cycle regulator n=1 Tax=Microvirga terrae TaxID=2740529 RepID=UPI003D81BE4B